jgi:hypothetical protein
MSVWLDVPQALVLIGQESGDVSVPTFEGALNAACDLVEGKRPDLLSDDTPPVFVATGAIKLGTAMLAHRYYARRSAPLGAAQFTEFGAGTILRYDPDIGRLLGLGTEGGFVFGAASLPVEVEEVV